MSSGVLHVVRDKLSRRTLDTHDAITSLTGEFDAVDCAASGHEEEATGN